MAESKAERVIHPTRWWGAYWLIGVAWILGAASNEFEWSWWAVVPGMVPYLIFMVLLNKFRKRVVVES